jgi:hypothetical protein
LIHYQSFSQEKNFMNKLYRSLTILCVSLTVSICAKSQILAWNFTSAAGSEPSFNATTVNENLNGSSITRGNGLTATGLANAFSASGWNVPSEADAITNNKYFEFSINAKSGYKVSLSTLDAYFRRSSTGPNIFQWKYSLDGFVTPGVNIGTNISYTGTNTNGDPQTQINLGLTNAVQNVPNTTTIKIRLYGWGASSSAGTFALGRPTNNSLSIGGTVLSTSASTSVININPTSLSGFISASGSPSGAKSITVSGTDLSDNISLNSSGPFEISTDNLIFSSSLTLTPTNGVLNNTTVHVRISKLASIGSVSGSVLLSSAGAANKTVTLSGLVAGVINLAGSPYFQNFDAIGTGLPIGVSVRTSSTSSAMGTDASFSTAAVSWNNTSGAFKNFASGNNEPGVIQSSATDRALGVRQTGSFGDPGAAFVFQVANTSNKINFTLDFNLQSLDNTSPRTTTWRVDYGVGVNPTSFTVPATTGTLITGGNSFSNNPIHVDFGSALDNQPDVITIRIVALSSSIGTLNRPSTGVDDFKLTWEDPSAKTFSLNATAINFPLTNIGNSNTSSYKIVSQTNLDNPIEIVASAPYTISTDNSSFVSNLSIDPADAFNKTIYVKFAPSAAGVYPGTITHSSEGAGSKVVNLFAEAVDPNSLTFNFNTCSVSNIPGSGFLSINTTGSQKWKCSQFGRNGTNGVDVNGFANGAAQTTDAWLISPVLNLNNIVHLPVLSFYSRGEFAGPKLQLYVSTTYDGSSVPNPSDWTELNGNFPTPPGSATTTWTFSDNIDLSAYKSASKVYIAFRYTSSAALSAARWSIDDIAITDQSTLLTVNATQLNFGEVSVGTNSSSQAVTLKAIGSNDLTLTPPIGYQISSDNSSFSASGIVVDEATAAVGTKFYIRFSPVVKALKVEGNINVSADGLNKDIVALTGSSFPKAETFDVACYNISFFGAGSTNSATPEQITTQIANVSTVMQKLNADVIGIEEMSNDAALAQLVATLPGYSSVVSNRWSYSFNPPDADFPPQKIGFIYNTATMTLSTDEQPRVMFESLYDSARLNLPGHRLTDYPTGTPSSFWASGRLPFMATFNATIDGATKKVRVIVIHAKSGGDNDGYIRRQYDVKLLKDSLDAFYSNDKVIIVGDYNDRMITSIYTGHPSSYQPFVDDIENYDILTKPLDAAGKTSFPGDAGMIDHITISNEFKSEYIANSTDIEDARIYIANYNSVSASDHLPVLSRFQFCKIARPANITVSNTTGQCGTLVSFDITSTFGCAAVTAIPASGSLFPIGTTTVQLTAATGDTASFKVTVVDDEKPLITAPSEVIANTDAGKCETSKDNVNLGIPTFSDNCSGSTVTNDAPFIFPAGNTTVTWTATDASGNTAIATQLVTIEDHELPRIVQPLDTVQSSETGKCSATISLPNPATTDNCGIASVTNDAPANGVFTVGTHVITWTVTDIHGNVSTAMQNVTVNDNENPTVTNCPVVPLFCYNSGGSYTIPAITATDNCGSVSFSYVISGATTRTGNSSNASGAFNIGVSTITWTVTDSHNNTTTCQTTVTVNSPVISSILDAYAVNPGGAANTIYVGYGPSSITLNASVSGGTAGYFYKWTIGSSAGPALNSTSSYSVSPNSITTYYLNVKDVYGCSAPVTTKTVYVTDVRCGPKMDKVTVCSVVKGKPTSNCIFQKDVASALASGATLGSCVNAAATTKTSSNPASNFILIINGMPNPSANYFTISIEGGEASEKMILQVTDVLGRVVEQKTNLQTNTTVQIGSNYKPGTYIAEIIQGSVRKQIKLVKL